MSATNREDAMSTTTDPVTALPPPDAAPETSKRFDRQAFREGHSLIVAGFTAFDRAIHWRVHGCRCMARPHRCGRASCPRGQINRCRRSSG